MTIIHLASIRACRGCGDRVGERLKAILEASRAFEGCLWFEIDRADDPLVWRMQGGWRSREAMLRYLEAPLLAPALSELLRDGLLFSLECGSSPGLRIA